MTCTCYKYIVIITNLTTILRYYHIEYCGRCSIYKIK